MFLNVFFRQMIAVSGECWPTGRSNRGVGARRHMDDFVLAVVALRSVGWMVKNWRTGVEQPAQIVRRGGISEATLPSFERIEVGAIHPKAMPVILMTPDELETWMTAPADESLSCSGRWRMGCSGSSPAM